MKSKEEVYQCKTGKALLILEGKTMPCENDEDCNRVLGQELAHQSKWDYECIKSGNALPYCCPVHKCGDDFTYMRTELECSDPEDCMKEQEDQSDAEARAVCTPYVEKNVENGKRCCPVSK
ncbi:unnamed protein product [Cylicocyclus nassatus]|uniref:Uncharacterized protein n=1 Tax=Cylicocyclus nassatus TaxID=53992 RepID=A0AA36GXH5_CYLNA|nr:unnamed protein product [Cylicocyclus nassatus]